MQAKQASKTCLFFSLSLDRPFQIEKREEEEQDKKSPYPSFLIQSSPHLSPMTHSSTTQTSENPQNSDKTINKNPNFFPIIPA